MSNNLRGAVFFYALAGFILLSVSAVFAKPPQLSFPLACTLGENCWTINYVDTDPSEAHRDFRCGSKTYEGHQGTDFAVRSRLEMEAGVDVLAAADGTILRFRDGESDSNKTEVQYQALRDANRDCGNGVFIDHGQGLQTIYCHLKLGSISVKRGQTVKAGDKIAELGQSGFSEFPHLHFGVIWEGGYVDPFTSLPMTHEKGCKNPQKQNLWSDNLTYEPYSVYDGGFRAGVPDFEDIKLGASPVTAIPQSSDALVYWAGFYHARKGDELTMKIEDPVGNIVVERSVTIDYSRKRPSFYYTGRKTENLNLIPGTYTGETVYKKPGHNPQIYIHKIEVR